MSAEEYDEAEKLFCGKWENVRNDMEEFLTAAEFPDEVKKMIQDEKFMQLTREDNSIHYKTSVGGVDSEFVIKLNEVTEWKEKDVDPVFHLKTIATSFKDGVWTEEYTPVRPNGGKRHILAVTLQDDMLNFDLSLPDVPNIRGKRVFKRCG